MLLAGGLVLLLFTPSAATAQFDGAPEVAPRRSYPGCRVWEQPILRRDPTEAEIRCRYAIRGPGRFGLSNFMPVPVYQPATPLPGTHVVGVRGLPRPWPGESHEEWEWRILRTGFGPEVRRVHSGLDLLDPVFASRLIEFEAKLHVAGVRFTRRETWRAPDRQAYLFQQGRSRPGPLITTTLTSWHSVVDERGTPSARAADYNVGRGQMTLFHEIAWATGLETYGPDSNDPGHVYLIGSASLSGEELVLLRLLPRVPYVTLSTGRPTDDVGDPASRADLRHASAEFASEPFMRGPGAIRIAGFPNPDPPRLTPISPGPLPDLTIRRRPPHGPFTLLVRWLRHRGR